MPAKTPSIATPTSSKARERKARAIAPTPRTASSDSAPARRVSVPAADILTMPSAQNARVLQAWGRLGDVDLSAIAARLREKSQAVIDGDTTTVEALLFDQALALQAIFTNLSIEASTAGYLSKIEPLLRMALKAQNQSRMTLETLAVVKNPSVVFARQANINNGGQQQVNNGTHVSRRASADKRGTRPLELLEVGDGERMDPRTTGAAGSADSPLEAVGAVHRSKDRRGKGAKLPEPMQRCAARDAPRVDEAPAARNRRSTGGSRPAVGETFNAPNFSDDERDLR